MLNSQQIAGLIQQNEMLQKQVKELEEILSFKEEELEMLRQQAGEAAALRSQLDLHADEIVNLQNQIMQQQRKTTSAAQRETDLHQELADSINLLQQQSTIKQQFIYTTTQLEDLEEELAKVKKKNMLLQKIAVQVGELESKLENLEFERDALLEKIANL